MTDSNYTAIAIVADRSGSMSSIKADAEGGINTFVDEQAVLPGKCTVRIDEFDMEFSTFVKSTPVKQVPEYKLVPRGSTALLDALGRTITEFGEELKAIPEDERPANVIVVVVTDGQENASVEWTAERVKELIKQQEEQWNWKFVFLAANQDAIATGAKYGFAKGSSLTYSPNKIGTAYSTASAAVTQTRSGGSWTGFSQQDRDNAS